MSKQLLPLGLPFGSGKCEEILAPIGIKQTLEECSFKTRPRSLDCSQGAQRGEGYFVGTDAYDSNVLLM